MLIQDYRTSMAFLGNLHRSHSDLGFTNGCFDLLHFGHADYLQKCRKKCKFLVVAVNSDNSVQRLKGSERPIISFEDRANLLLEFRSVDLVVGFDEDTPQNLIELLRPFYLFKGADYTLEEIAGARYVIENGGTVELIDYIEGCSTTNIIKKIKGVG